MEKESGVRRWTTEMHFVTLLVQFQKTDNTWRRGVLSLCFICDEHIFYCVLPSYQQECEAMIVE